MAKASVPERTLVICMAVVPEECLKTLKKWTVISVNIFRIFRWSFWDTVWDRWLCGPLQVSMMTAWICWSCVDRQVKTRQGFLERWLLWQRERSWDIVTGVISWKRFPSELTCGNSEKREIQMPGPALIRRFIRHMRIRNYVALLLQMMPILLCSNLWKKHMMYINGTVKIQECRFFLSAEQRIPALAMCVNLPVRSMRWDVPDIWM